ncbi:MAG: hypothetical protein II819_11555 [Fibrobacter sp.]|nr:hypothetical protein [Fibrobacter sp.]MBQ6770464.1 hypothetical protein [Bacteroidales bacterium]
MVTNFLTKALRELCEQAVKDFRLPTKDGKTLRAPQIVNGFLPPKRSTDLDDFPFVLVRPEQCTTDRESEEVRVNIIVGCYSEEYDGFEYGVNVVERIKEKICTLPDETLAKRYQMRYPIKWTMVPEQPWPQWQIDMETIWIFNSPRNTGDF